MGKSSNCCWSDEEIARLVDLLLRHNVREAAAALGRPLGSVRSAVWRFRAKCSRPVSAPWSAAESALLAELWPLYSAGRIAKRLDRSRNAVIGRVARMRADKFGTELISKATRPKQQELPRWRPGPRPKPKAQRPKMETKIPKITPHIQCPCRLVELGPDNCKWPIGDPSQPGFHFCGALTWAEGPYCLPHHRKAHHHEPRSTRPHDRRYSA